MFGVVSRSVGKTWPSIDRHLIAPLKSKCEVDLYVFDMLMDEQIKIDGVLVDNSVSAKPYNNVSRSSFDKGREDTASINDKSSRQ